MLSQVWTMRAPWTWISEWSSSDKHLYIHGWHHVHDIAGAFDRWWVVEVYMVSHAHGITGAWYRMRMVSSVHSIACAWYQVCIVSRTTSGRSISLCVRESISLGHKKELLTNRTAKCHLYIQHYTIYPDQVSLTHADFHTCVECRVCANTSQHRIITPRCLCLIY